MIQLDLALRAGFSSRHLSFIANRQAADRAGTVLALAEALDIRQRERNVSASPASYAQGEREQRHF